MVWCFDFEGDCLGFLGSFGFGFLVFLREGWGLFLGGFGGMGLGFLVFKLSLALLPPASAPELRVSRASRCRNRFADFKSPVSKGAGKLPGRASTIPS